MARKSKMTPVTISFRKADIYARRDPRVSSLEVAHSLLTKADPDLINLLEHKRRFLRSDYDQCKIGNEYV